MSKPTQAEALMALAAAIERSADVIERNSAAIDKIAALGDLGGEIKTLRQRLEEWPRMTANALAVQRNVGEKTRVAMEEHLAARGGHLAAIEKRVIEAEARIIERERKLTESAK